VVVLCGFDVLVFGKNVSDMTIFVSSGT